MKKANGSSFQSGRVFSKKYKCLKFNFVTPNIESTEQDQTYVGNRCNEVLSSVIHVIVVSWFFKHQSAVAVLNLGPERFSILKMTEKVEVLVWGKKGYPNLNFHVLNLLQSKWPKRIKEIVESVKMKIFCEKCDFSNIKTDKWQILKKKKFFLLKMFLMVPGNTMQNFLSICSVVLHMQWDENKNTVYQMKMFLNFFCPVYDKESCDIVYRWIVVREQEFCTNKVTFICFLHYTDLG